MNFKTNTYITILRKYSIKFLILYVEVVYKYNNYKVPVLKNFHKEVSCYFIQIIKFKIF